MGWLDTLGRWLTGNGAPSPSTAAGTRGIASPWATGQLEQIVWRDILGTEEVPVSRQEAMGIPAVARARHTLAVDAMRVRLDVYDGATGTTIPQAGNWLQRTDLPTSPQVRMVWTVDDLIFHGWSLWIVRRDDDGAILDGARCPIEWWTFGDNGEVLINSQTVDADSVLLIPGFHEGIINFSPRTIRGARELETQWAHRAANPIPALELHQTTDDELDDDEIKAMVADWKNAITDSGGAVAYTPRSVEARVHGTATTDLLIEGRNAAAIDAARVVGIPAAMVDASNVNSTLTYETLEGRSSEYVERSLPLYLGPVEARLSLDDVTAPGTLVRADTSTITRNPPAPTVAAITKD